MRYQQNLPGRKIAVMVLGRQQWRRILPHVALVVDAVDAAGAGSFTEVDIPSE
jgi:hypothetical protein